MVKNQVARPGETITGTPVALAGTQVTPDQGRGSVRRALTTTATIAGSFLGGIAVVSIAAALFGFWPQAAPTTPNQIVAPEQTTGATPTTTTTPAPGQTTEPNTSTETPGATDQTPAPDGEGVTFVGTSEAGRGEACRAVVDAFSDGKATPAQMNAAAGLTTDSDLARLIATIGKRLPDRLNGDEITSVIDYCNNLSIAY